MAGPPDPATTEWVPIWTPMNTGPVGPQGPQGTPGEKWFAGTGAPSGSLATSIVGDWYLDTTTGDVYEKTGASTWTVRANIKGPQGVQGIQGIQGPIGATGPSGSTAAHHVNHEVGGSDYLVNSAWLNQPNVFTQLQTVSATTLPKVVLNESNQPANQRRWVMTESAGELYFQPADDTSAGLLTALKLGRDGGVVAGTNLSALGSAGNVACKDQQNIFTAAPQTITHTNAPSIHFNEAQQAAGLKRWLMMVNGSNIHFQPTNDAGAALLDAIVFYRNGSAYFSAGITEQGRASAMGQYIDVPFSAGNFYSGTGSYTVSTQFVNSYSLVGRTMHWDVMVLGTAIGAGAIIYFRLPASMTLARPIYTGGVYAGTNGNGQIEGRQGDSFVYVYRNQGGTPWNDGTLYLGFSLSFFI